MIFNKLIVNARFLTQPITGVQRFALEISKQIKIQLGDKVKFLSPVNILHTDIALELEVEIVGKNQGHLWEQLDLPLYLKKNGSPLLINLANSGPLYYDNKISTIHDVAFNVYPETFNKRFLYFYKFMIPILLSGSKHVLTVSEFSKNEIQNFYKIEKDKISVIFNSVDKSFEFQNDPELREENYYLAVSSLNYRKNLVSVLTAFDQLNKDNKSIKLYIIGDLITKSFQEVKIDHFLENKNIKFLGRLSDSDLIKYYSNALAFVYPSLYEGFGLPPLEAQSCKCPVLVSNTSCLPEIFKDSVMYCDPKSIDSIRDGMINILNSSFIPDLKINSEKNLLRFSWEKSAKSLIEIVNRYL